MTVMTGLRMLSRLRLPPQSNFVLQLTKLSFRTLSCVEQYVKC